MIHTITPCLWFDSQGEEAAELYTQVFPRSRITQVTRYGPAGPGVEGSVMTVAFELDGQPLVALNGGPAFTFTPAISLQVACETQEEVDHFWYGLSQGGQQGQCGWLTDRFGVSWQVVPTALPELLEGPDQAAAQRATEAMLTMGRLEIDVLRRAALGQGNAASQPVSSSS